MQPSSKQVPPRAIFRKRKLPRASLLLLFPPKSRAFPALPTSAGPILCLLSACPLGRPLPGCHVPISASFHSWKWDDTPTLRRRGGFIWKSGLRLPDWYKVVSGAAPGAFFAKEERREKKSPAEVSQSGEIKRRAGTSAEAQKMREILNMRDFGGRRRSICRKTNGRRSSRG